MVLLCPWQPELLRKETAPQVLSWSPTFSFRYECGCQLKGVWKKKSSTTRQQWHRSQLPDLHLLTSEPADVSEVSLGTDRLYKLTEEPSLSLRFCRRGRRRYEERFVIPMGYGEVFLPSDQHQLGLAWV